MSGPSPLLEASPPYPPDRAELSPSFCYVLQTIPTRSSVMFFSSLLNLYFWLLVCVILLKHYKSLGFWKIVIYSSEKLHWGIFTCKFEAAISMVTSKLWRTVSHCILSQPTNSKDVFWTKWKARKSFGQKEDSLGNTNLSSSTVLEIILTHCQPKG